MMVLRFISNLQAVTIWTERESEEHLELANDTYNGDDLEELQKQLNQLQTQLDFALVPKHNLHKELDSMKRTKGGWSVRSTRLAKPIPIAITKMKYRIAKSILREDRGSRWAVSLGTSASVAAAGGDESRRSDRNQPSASYENRNHYKFHYNHCIM